jgi:hypothetical protein
MYAGTSRDGTDSPVMMGLTAGTQLQPQTAPGSKSLTSTPASLSKDKVQHHFMSSSSYRTRFLKQYKRIVTIPFRLFFFFVFIFISNQN